MRQDPPQGGTTGNAVPRGQGGAVIQPPPEDAPKRNIADAIPPKKLNESKPVYPPEAEKEGLDQIFRDAGFDWRGAGCSMCLGMNPDILSPGERCASTSNRNFEGRQGKGGRTHLVSPQMAAAAAIEGRFVDIREWEGLDR